jgi:hypothetical protein
VTDNPGGISRTIPCLYCGKKFHDENGRWTHTKSKHPGRKNPRPHDDSEPSMAELFIDAQIYTNDPDLDWVRDMLP